MHLAAWSGLRAGELCGLQVGDIDWPMNPNGTVWLRVRRTVSDNGGELTYDTTKTKGSNRRVPLRSATAQLLRDYLDTHPRADEPTAPLFCAVTLTRVKPTGKRASATKPAKPLTAAQKAAADALIAGPRKGVYGPFLPLMQSPALLDRVASVGEYLRFDSVVDARLR